MALLLFGHFSVSHAENMFRPQKNSDQQQITQLLPEFMQPIIKTIRKLQATYLADVSQYLRDIKQQTNTKFSLSLLLLSFLYGLFHAAGPGHGKAIISAYLLSSKAQLHQAIQIAFFASMLQAITAITIIFGGLFLLGSSVSNINQSFVYFELFSYGLIILLGLILLIGCIKKIHSRSLANRHHIHNENCSCGHNHMPTPTKNPSTLKQKLLVIFSIGIRPCTGALIILILAHSLQLYMTAILATFLMALGTFTTISLIATFAVFIQKTTDKLTSSLTTGLNAFIIYLADILKIALSLFIILLGGLLLAISI